MHEHNCTNSHIEGKAASEVKAPLNNQTGFHQIHISLCCQLFH